MQIETLVDSIAGEDGFWKKSTRACYLDAARTLLSLGMGETDVINFLEKLYFQTCEEFGA